MITPFLTLVLAGYAAFILVLGTVSLQQAVSDVRTKRAERR